MKSVLFSCLFFGLLLFSAGVVRAEGNCPEGYYPIGGESGQAGPQGCAPIPGYGQQQAPQPPPEQWASHWGAIVTDAVKGVLGTATDMANKNEAEQKAMTDCQTKGGTQCKLQNSYGNACVAMITGDKGFNVGSYANLNQAIQSGMTKCNATDTNCHVYYSACSLPQRIQ